MQTKAKQKMLKILKDRSKLKEDLYPSVMELAKAAGANPDDLWNKLLERIEVLNE